MFIAARVTIAKRQKHPNVHQLVNGKRNVLYPYNGILLSHNKQ
jgi:hypothetical protein